MRLSERAKHGVLFVTAYSFRECDGLFHEAIYRWGPDIPLVFERVEGIGELVEDEDLPDEVGFWLLLITDHGKNGIAYQITRAEVDDLREAGLLQ